MRVPTLHLADPLRNACQHCATIARARMSAFFDRGLVPTESDETATVTFIKVLGRSFAVTAWHVVDIFAKQAKMEKCSPEAYCLPANPGRILQPLFVQPPAAFLQRAPDVAIMPIDEGLPASIGKETFEILELPQPVFPLSHALAVGFPTGCKLAVKVEGTERMSLPCVWAVAEGVSTKDATADQVQFFSPIGDLPEVRALSGMSGGPVFWSNANDYGLLGFVKEAPEVVASDGGTSFIDGPRVHFICQRATYDDLSRWANFAGARKKQ